MNANIFNKTSTRGKGIRARTETAIYLDYNDGKCVEIGVGKLCPDCTTPTVWIERMPDGKPYVSEVYHDKTCIQVKCGVGKVAPSLEEQRRGRR